MNYHELSAFMGHHVHVTSYTTIDPEKRNCKTTFSDQHPPLSTGKQLFNNHYYPLLLIYHKATKGSLLPSTIHYYPLLSITITIVTICYYPPYFCYTKGYLPGLPFGSPSRPPGPSLERSNSAVCTWRKLQRQRRATGHNGGGQQKIRPKQDMDVYNS